MAPKKKDPNVTVDLDAAEPVGMPIARPASPSSRSPQASLLMITGFGVTVFGLALSLGPSISWQISKVTDGLAGLGVHGGSLFIGGLVLFGLGMLRRGQVNLANKEVDSGIDPELLEDMASDVVRMGSAFDHVSQLLTSTQEQLAELKAIAERPPEPAPVPPPTEGTGSEDAIFRMAASLDKVGAKIEERLKTQFSEMQSRMEKVEATLVQAQIDMTKMSEPAAARAVDAAPVEAPPMPTPEPEVAQQPPASEGSLGVLDDLHDPVESALPSQQPQIDFDQADGLTLGSVQPPTPAGQETWDLGPQNVQPDENLRSALEDMRRTGEPPRQPGF